MDEVLLYLGIFTLSVFISSLSQIILKKSALKQYENKIKEYINPFVIIAYGLFFTSSFLTIFAYRYVPLSMGPILESLGYIFVGILSFFILKEKLSRRKVIGMIVIILGIAIFSY